MAGLGAARKSQVAGFVSSALSARRARGGLKRPQRSIGIGFGKVGPVWFFEANPRRVNKRMMRVMILRSIASSSSVEGAAASWKTGTPLQFR